MKKKNILIITLVLDIIILFIYGKLYAQCVIIWTQRYGSGYTNDYSWDVKVDNSGYIYVTGETYNGSDWDCYTIKYSSSGNKIWAKQYDSGGNNEYSHGIIIDKEGYVYITGYKDNSGDYDYFTIKYDSDGNTIWTQSYNYNGSWDYAWNIVFDNSDNLYITGYSYNGNNYDYLTIKYDSDGNTIWTQRYDSGTNEGARDIAIDNNNYIYVTGVSYNGTNDDFLTIKYDSNGNIIWLKRYDKGGYECANGIEVDNNGYIYVTGYSYIQSNADFLTIKYDDNGNIIWSKQYDKGDDDYGNRLTIDSLGYVYVIGQVYNGTNNDYFTIKYDSDGNTIWTQRYDTGSDDYGYGIAVDQKGAIYLTGFSYNGSNYDFLTIKYEQPPYPDVPSGLLAEEDDRYIKLSWKDNTINERGFKIYKSCDGINYYVIGRVKADITTYIDTEYNDLKTNWYKVSATNLAGEIISESIKLEKKEKKYSLQNIVMVPNPCYLKNNNDKITFYKVSEGVNIKIYQIDGKLIKRLGYKGGNKIEWNLKDKNGKKLSSGIYIAKIKDKQGNKREIVFSIKY